MKPGHLSQYFCGVAAKHLSPVEVDPEVSHHHEFNGAAPLKEILGVDEKKLSARFLYLNDSEEVLAADSGLKWYDARAGQPKRSAEYRLVYHSPAEEVVQHAAPGDLLVVALKNEKEAIVIIAKKGSTPEQQLKWLFNLNVNGSFEVKNEAEIDAVKLGTAAESILNQAGIEVDKTDDNYLETILKEFGMEFPKTDIFSKFARSTLEKEQIDPTGKPDEAILTIYERENLLFKTLEKHIIEIKLKEGFKDVDDFVDFSLSIQNRRKSRAGSAFENHLQYIFEENKLKFSRGKITERNSKPDFIFPGIDQYRDPGFPADQLIFLGAKTTCKDRWRQILKEASKIESKHLITIEPGISQHQTDDMQHEKVQLILPRGLHNTYLDVQKAWLMDLEGFLSLAKEKQT